MLLERVSPRGGTRRRLPKGFPAPPLCLCHTHPEGFTLGGGVARAPSVHCVQAAFTSLIVFYTTLFSAPPKGNGVKTVKTDL